MAAEYLFPSSQNVTLNSSLLFDNSIPCTRGNVFHESGTGIFILRGNTPNCFARYVVTYNGNLSLPEGATVAPIAVAIAVNGEQRASSKAIYTPAAVEEYGNVTSTAVITVPKGCCFTVSVDYVSGTEDATVTPPTVITAANSNFVINRIA